MSVFEISKLSRLQAEFLDVGGAGRIYPAQSACGQKVWVKRVLGAKYSFKRNVSAVVVNGVIDHALLKRVAYMDPKQGLRVEAQRLKEFSQKNILVPRILKEHEDYLVLSDMGQAAHEVLQQEGKKGGTVAKAVAIKLGEMHQVGAAHGDAIVKNFTLYGDKVQDVGQIGVIDLEATPEIETGFHSKAALDVWGYSYSLVRGYGGAHFSQKDVISELVADYMDHIPTSARKQVANDLKYMATSLSGVFASALKGVRVHRTVGWHMRTRAAVLAAL